MKKIFVISVLILIFSCFVYAEEKNVSVPDNKEQHLNTSDIFVSSSAVSDISVQESSVAVTSGSYTAENQVLSSEEKKDYSVDSDSEHHEKSLYMQSGAIIEEAAPASAQELDIPQQTSAEISAEQALNKLGVEVSSDTVSVQSYNVSVSSLSVSSSSVPSAGLQDNNIRHTADKTENKSNVADKEVKKEDDKAENKSFIDTILPSKLLTRLPFESKLQLSGRKLIGVNYKGTIYDNEKSGVRSNTDSFSMDQELQMKIKGKVGDRLELNVDYDDTQDDKKDISIVYKGQGNEFVQEAAFGDINVSLPSTEFSGYSKELFGAKINTKYKGLTTDAFFSKTKGYSETKRFTGSTKSEKKIIADTSYIRFKYYFIKKNSGDTVEPRTIKSGTAKVFLDKGSISPSDYIVISTATQLKYLQDQTHVPYKGNFVKLVAGTDYTIDYNTNVITFKSVLSKQAVVAIDYQFTDNSWLSSSEGDRNGQPLIIKDVNNIAGLSTELYTYYSLGNYNINKYNGRDNFILKVKDLSDNEPSEIEGGKPVPKFPNIDGYSANITVDFDNGIFNLQPLRGMPLHDDLYTANKHKYNFITEYNYNVKIFTLRSDIIAMSEKVVVDGKTLKINEDYIIDYDVGILTIVKDDLIKENTVIDVSYDYSPFGSSSAGSTMLGIRSQYDFNGNISVGGSAIYEFTAEEADVPDLYSTPSSTLVSEVDLKLKDVKITDNLSFSASGEYAKSQYNENITGKAIIESMEGAKTEDTLSLIDDDWFYAATPDKFDGTVCKSRYDLKQITWKNYDMNKKDIETNLEIIDGEKQQVMDIKYDFTTGGQNYVSVAQIISNSGYDFSEKLYFETWIKADFSKVKIQIDYADQINEDSDRDGVLDTEDKNGDGILSPWEDTGRDFHDTLNPDPYKPSVSKIGANNGKLDTEDINGNNILENWEFETQINSFVLSNDAFSGNPEYTVSKYPNGWYKIKIPVKDSDKWKNIRVARLTVYGDYVTGTLTIGKISVVGNKWTDESKKQLSSEFKISSIGRDDIKYDSLVNNSYYRDLYDINSSTKREEQSLALNYKNVSDGDRLYAKTTYTSKLDISNYGKFRFFIYVTSDTEVSGQSEFVMQIGGSKDNYFEYALPLTDDLKGKWTLITIRQEGYGVTAKWVPENGQGVVRSTGTPTLQHISFIQTGIHVKGSDSSGEIWVNEIHVTDSKTKEGVAWKADMNLRWGGTGIIGSFDLNLYRKSIDKDFQTFAPGTYDRQYLEDKASVQFAGLNIAGTKVLPLDASLVKTKVVTPAAIDNTSDVVSIKDEGKVVTYTGRAQTVISAGNDLPKVTLQYTRQIADTQEIKQLEDMETIDANMIYKNPVDFDILPESITADYRVKNSYYKKYPDEPVKDSDNFLDVDTMKKYIDVDEFLTLEKTETIGLKTPFNFLNKIKFTPGYVLTKVNEKNRQYFENQEIFYDKSLNQDIGANLNLEFAKWFKPNVVYNIATVETYDLNYSSAPSKIIYPGQKKSVNRAGTTELTWNLQARDILDSKYLKSLTFTTSYRMQDSDTYEGIEKEFSSIGLAMDKIWIRNNLMKRIPESSTETYTVKTVVQRDDKRFIGRYNPFEAFNISSRLAPLKTMAVSFTFTEGNELSYNTGTEKDSYTRIWPDIILGMTRFEKLFDIKWMSDTQLNLKHNKQTNTVKGVSFGDSVMYGGDYRFKLFKKYDLLFEANTTSVEEYDIQDKIVTKRGQLTNLAVQAATDIKQWRMNLRYENLQDWTKNAKGEFSSQVFSNKITYQVTSDLMFPAGLKIPFFGVIPLKNRLIFDSSCFYNMQKSDVDIEKNNLNSYGLDISADYEISKNFRCTLEAGMSRYEYTFVPDENYMLMELAAKVTIQF